VCVCCAGMWTGSIRRPVVNTFQLHDRRGIRLTM
jgi:hypothetical protein